MRNRLKNPTVKFYIGDVRDTRAVDHAVKGVDYIFHAAALKQVPSCEFFPVEAVRTNVLGAENVMVSAVNYGVKRLVGIRSINQGNFIDFVNNLLTVQLNKGLDLVSTLN